MYLFSLLILAKAQIRIPIEASESKIHSDIVESFNKFSDGLKISKLYNHEEYLYTAIVKIGSDKQEFNLYIDTGCSALWVESYDCGDCYGLKKQFDPDKSKTFTSSIDQKTIVYDSGSSVTGFYSEDQISIGDDPVMTTTGNFLLVTKDSLNSITSGFDGILGLAFEQLNYGYPTLIDSLYASNLITRRIFAIYLNRLGRMGDESGYGDNPSTLEIGTYDYKKYTGTDKPIVYTVQIINNGFWLSEDLESLSIDGFTQITTDTVEFDTGSPYIVVDYLTLDSIYNWLSLDNDCLFNDENTFFRCKCSSSSSMPSMIFNFNSFSLKVTETKLWLYEKDYCYLLVTSSSSGTWTLGIPSLQDYYMVYDMDKMTISISETHFEDSSSSSSSESSSWASRLIASGILVISSLI